ncbi:MFS transporter [Mycobacterium deserti]|uniref:MFS transporter n=1 Tax=Mycobacterium deserti TaxID=2978347 RepID=A0ABT2MA28_9MYCO|nr:MFS transporter [Mycobacterium deserti]MCT7658449.1 MFS transporter [Mycobacterium deserti]
MSDVIARPAGTREWVGLGLLALPTALLGLDVTVLYLAAPSLAADLRPSATEMLWVMDVYGLMIAGFLITMGTLGDRIGRRRLLMIGAVAFCFASIAAAFAPDATWLIVARALLGVAGATLMPSTLALIGNMFADRRQRALAIGVWATVFALGMAAGPLVGALLLAHFWWGSAFLVAVPLVAVLVAAAPIVLPEYKAPHEGGFDIVSVALSLAAILPIVYAVKHVAVDGIDIQSLIAAVVGAGSAVLFVLRQRVLTAPLLDMTLFTSRAFTAALCVLLIGLIGVGGVMMLVTQYLQLIEGFSATESGLWMGPPAMAMFVAAIGAPLVARRARPGVVMAVTLALSLVGYALLATTGAGQPITVAVGFALVYLGLGAIAALGTDIVVGAAPPSKAGSAAAMSEMVQELGLAVGVALLGSLTTVMYRANIDIPVNTSPDVADHVREDLSSAVAVAAERGPHVVGNAHTAFMAGFNTAAVVAALAVGIVTVVCATMLRHIRPVTNSEP